MNNLGYIKLSRKITEWRWYHDENTMRVFLHLLLTVNIKDKDFEKITIRRGEIATSYASLSKQLEISVQCVRTAISHLILTGEITSRKYPKFQVISIVNYDLYQANQQGEQQATNNQLTGNQQATNRQLTTTKECKNIRMEEDNISLAQSDASRDTFLRLWSEYPRKRGKSSVSNKAIKEIEQAGYETVHGALVAYVEECEREHRADEYIMYGSTFFNGAWKEYVGADGEKDKPTDETPLSELPDY